jgi:protein-disulfide isomerase
MINASRRNILKAGAGLAALAVLMGQAQALDMAEFMAPPALGEMSLGPADAKVTIVEYASATCPHCADFHKGPYADLKKEYIDTNKIRFVFREFPLNDSAMAAFMIARAAPKESYFPLLDIFFATLETWAANPAEELFKIAQQAGFTKEKFDATLRNEELAKGILAIRDAGAKFGVEGTPTLFINGEIFSEDRTIEALRAKIDPLLQ